jgi:hypothetical protein
MDPSFPTVSRSGFKRTIAFRVLGVLAGVVLAIAAIVLFPLAQDMVARMQGAMMLGEVRTVEGPLEERAVYAYSGTDRMQVALAPGKLLVDYDRNGGHEAALVYDSATRIASIVLPSDPSQPLVDDPSIKSSISIAQDGETVAYAELVRLEGGAALASLAAFYDPDRWLVKTVDVTTGAITTHGIGYAPRLFARDGVEYVLFTNGVGVRIASLAPRAGQDVVYATATNGLAPAEIADDGSVLALFDDETKSYQLHRVDSIGPSLALAQLPTLERIQRIAFEDGAAVGIRAAHRDGITGFDVAHIEPATGAVTPAYLRLKNEPVPNRIIP